MGISKEVWSEVVFQYESMACAYGFISDQRYMYLHNIVAGDAGRYYLNALQGHSNDCTGAVAMI